MQVLTPSGYVDASTLQVGDSVCAFDENTGAPILNQVETVAYVDLPEWQRWWKPMVDSGELAGYPPFAFYKINGTWTLNSEQSIWRNGTNVCHVHDLVVGDTIYDDADNPVVISSIEVLSDAGWWRFDISGDHSYISDGLTLHNASRFWVTGTGTWDLSTTTHWAASTGGAGGQSAPGSADTCTFDGSSGGGTVTPSYGGTGTFQTITNGAFTGTLDWSVNNESVTLSTSYSGTGTGTRTINLGNGTWTLSTTVNALPWNMTTVTGLTFNANSSTISFSANTNVQRSFAGGGKSFNIILCAANSSSGIIKFGDALVVATLNIVGRNTVQFTSALTHTITNAFSWGTSSALPIFINTDSGGSIGTISVASGAPTMQWAAIKDITCTGGATFTATSSFDLGRNSGITITAPSAGGPVGQFISHQRGTPY